MTAAGFSTFIVERIRHMIRLYSMKTGKEIQLELEKSAFCRNLDNFCQEPSLPGKSWHKDGQIIYLNYQQDPSAAAG